MRVALIQMESVAGDIEVNIRKHLHWIEEAVTEKVDLVVFPELSLSGYEPTLAEELAMELSDSRLEVFQQKADEFNLSLFIGLPLVAVSGVEIGMAIFQPRKAPIAYSKQILHEDELPYFVPGKHQQIVDVSGVKVAPAICYESLQDEHHMQAIALGAELYVASVAKPESGVVRAFTHFQEMSSRFKIPVLMANSIGSSDNFIAAGQSAYWTQEGEMQGVLSAQKEGILLFNYNEEN